MKYREVVYVSPYVIPTIKADGGQDVAMCAALAELGLDVHLVHLRDPNATASSSMYEHYGVPDSFSSESVPYAPPGKGATHRLQRIPRRIFALAADVSRRISTGQRASRRSSTALFLTRDPLVAWWIALRRRSVVWEALSFPDRVSAVFARRLLRSPSLKAAIAITQHLATDILRLLRSPIPIRVLPMGVDLDRYATLPESSQACRDQTGLSRDVRLVVYTGGMRAERGVEVLVRAASLLPETKFVLAGGRPEEIRALATLAQETGADNVDLLGMLPPTDIPVLQRAADVLVLPQVAANRHLALYVSPAKLFEYMAARRPIVAANLPCIREVLKDQETGLLVDPESPVAWADAIARLLGDDQLRLSLARASEATVGRFVWTERARQVLGWARWDNEP